MKKKSPPPKPTQKFVPKNRNLSIEKIEKDNNNSEYFLRKLENLREKRKKEK